MIYRAENFLGEIRDLRAEEVEFNDWRQENLKRLMIKILINEVKRLSREIDSRDELVRRESAY